MPSSGPKEPAASYIPIQPNPTIMSRMRITYIVALVPLLASCASSGLYNMSDQWCATHLSASAARCPKEPERVAHNETPRVAHNAPRQND